jgi:iron complex transport system substrate-binding protein
MKRRVLCIGLILGLLLSGCGQQGSGASSTEAVTVSAEAPVSVEEATIADSAEAPVEEISAIEASAVEESSVEEAEEGPVEFQDDLGRDLSLERNPQRVATLIGSFADIWCLAGGKDTLVATANDTWTSFDLDLDETVANLGAIKEPSLETLIAAEPDLVIASCNTEADVELLETLESMGIPVVYFEVSSFEDYLRMLDICTQLTGHTENYETYGQALQEEINEAKAMADGTEPSVLYVRATSSSCKVKNSEDSVLGEMLLDLDCQNIADSDTGLLENLSLEAILADDPDYIFVVIQGSDPTDAEAMLESTLLSNPAWESLTAVQEGRYYVLDQSLYNLKPNARWGEAYTQLAEILYGEE